MKVKVEVEDAGCCLEDAGGGCNCESIAACAGSRSEVSMSASTIVGAVAGVSVKGTDLTRFSHAAFSSSSL